MAFMHTPSEKRSPNQVRREAEQKKVERQHRAIVAKARKKRSQP